MDTTSNYTTPEVNECIPISEEIYNLSYHIISIFVLLIVSIFGAAVSVLSTRVKCLHVNPIIINTGKFFGSGYVK